MKEFWNVIQMVFTAVGGWLRWSALCTGCVHGGGLYHRCHVCSF